jgi:hypothetical protein
MPKRPPRQVTISISEARDLAAPADAKGNPQPLNSCVAFSLLDLPKAETEVVPDSTSPAYGFSTTLSVPTDDASLAQLVAAPLVFSVCSGEAKDVCGVVSLPLAPLLQQAAIEEQWLPLQPGPDGGEVVGELLVSVEAESPLLSEDDFEESSVLTVHLHAMHKLPERWLLTEGQGAEDHIFSYKAGILLQVGAGLPPIEIPAGLIQQAAAPPAPPAAEGEGEAPAAEGGDAPAAEAPAAAPEAAPEAAPGEEAPEDLSAGNAEEKAAQSIAFGASITTFLGPEAMAALREATEAGVAPLSVSLAREVKNPEAHIDPNAAKYRGVVAVPFELLMAVDETAATVRAPVAVDASEVPEAEPAAPPDKGKKGKGPEELPVEEEDEVHPFEASGTYVRVQLSMTRPLNPRPPTPPPPLPRPSEIIPKRQLPQLAPKSAADEFEAQVGAIVQSMVAEWRQLFPDFDANAIYSTEDKEERRRTLLFNLNSSGQYYIFKEKLKRSVVRLVKETMHRPTAAPADAQQME